MPMLWEDQIFLEDDEPRPSGFHAAISTKIPEREIIARAAALGWRTVTCERAGIFGLVEVWVDDEFLVEVLVPKEVERYQNFMNPEGCARMFGPGTAPEPLL